jgi:aspartate aminotransferase
MILRSEVTDTVSLEFSELARQKTEQHQKIISLGLGEPSIPTPDIIIDAAYESMKSGGTRYSSPWGISELREKIAINLRRSFSREISPANVIITLGAKQALSLSLMALLEPGDEVIIFSPCYVSYIPQVYMAEPAVTLKIIELRRDDFGIDFDFLKAQITQKTKAIIINFPHNPTGKVLSPEELDQLVSIVMESGAFLISDEIYSKLIFSGKIFKSIGVFSELGDRCIVIDGFSKAFSMTGWRIGYLYGSAAFLKKISSIQQHLNTNIPVFIQKAASRALDLPEDFHETYNSLLRRNGSLLCETLRNVPVIKYIPPDGGLFGFVNISETGMDSDSFCTKLLQEKSVAITPGKAFGINWDDHIRISLAPDEASFGEGIKRLADFMCKRW